MYPSAQQCVGEAAFRINVSRPVAEMLREARQLTPPVENGDLITPDLVDLHELDATLQLDVRYATDDNVLGAPLYPTARAVLQRPAAEGVVGAHRELMERGAGLIIYDAYRPWHVTKVLWDAAPDALRHFVADPAAGSRHNRGCAVDVGLFNVASGKPLEMPCPFDEFTERAHVEYERCSPQAKANRDLLRATMERHGFKVYAPEWWHFDYHGWRQYPVLNVDLRDL